MIYRKIRKSGGILTEMDRDFLGGQGIELAPGPKELMNTQRFLSVSQPYEAIRETLPFVQYVQRKRRSDGTGISDPDSADTFSEA